MKPAGNGGAVKPGGGGKFIAPAGISNPLGSGKPLGIPKPPSLPVIAKPGDGTKPVGAVKLVLVVAPKASGLNPGGAIMPGGN